MTYKKALLEYAKYLREQAKLYREWAKSFGDITAQDGPGNPPPPPGLETPIKPPPTP